MLNRFRRLLWLLGGLLAVGVGTVGIVLPGLPTTGFFIIAAWCFSKSSTRLERWVLGLPGIGPMVVDYRDGLGMSRRVKAWAIGVMLTMGGVSVVFVLDHLVARIVVCSALALGIWSVAVWVPTRETVLRERAAND